MSVTSFSERFDTLMQNSMFADEAQVQKVHAAINSCLQAHPLETATTEVAQSVLEDISQCVSGLKSKKYSPLKREISQLISDEKRRITETFEQTESVSRKRGRQEPEESGVVKKRKIEESSSGGEEKRILRKNFELALRKNIPAMFPDLPLELTEFLDAMTRQKSFVPELQILIELNYVSVLECPSEMKAGIIKKILSEFPTTPKIMDYAQQILASPEISTKALNEKATIQTQQILAQVNKLIENLEDGWVKKRLQQVIMEHQANNLESNIALYKRYLACVPRYGELFKQQEVKTFDEYTESLRKIEKDDMERIFSLAISQCFNSMSGAEKKILVSGFVSSDGWGDYFQMWLSARSLKQAMPLASVSVLTGLASSPPQLPLSSEVVENLCFSSDEEYAKKQVEKHAGEADCVIRIPQAPAINPGHKPMIEVEEYGYPPSKEGYALGLSFAEDINTLGISFSKMSDATSIDALSCSSLRSQLGAKKRPFFVGYLKKDRVTEEAPRCGFILAAAAFATKRKEDIDIVCPLESLDQLDQNALRKCGVARVVLMRSDENKELRQSQTLQLQSEGKEIRILDPFPLNNEDLSILYKFSEPLAGCTGDVSFSEVLAYGKIPFYQIRRHKGEFARQLSSLATLERLPHFSNYLSLIFHSLFEASKLDDFSERCMRLGALCTKECEEESKQLSDRIREYSSANDMLANLVKRTLAHASHPSLKRIEDEAAEEWISGKITLLEAYTKVQQALLPQKSI